MKRTIKVTLCMLMIFVAGIMYTACSSNSVTENKNTTDIYISMAEKFISQEDYDSAKEVLAEALKNSDSQELRLLYDSVVKLSEKREGFEDISNSLYGEWYLGGPEAFMTSVSANINEQSDLLVISGNIFDYINEINDAKFSFSIKKEDIYDRCETIEFSDDHNNTYKAEVTIENENINNLPLYYLKCRLISLNGIKNEAVLNLYNTSYGRTTEGIHLIKAYCDTSTEYMDRSSVIHGGNILNMSLDKNLLTLNYTSVMPGSGEMAEINHVTDLSELKYSDTEYSYYLEFPYTDNHGETGNVKFTFGSGNGGHMIFVDVSPTDTTSEAWSIASTQESQPLLEQR